MESWSQSREKKWAHLLLGNRCLLARCLSVGMRTHADSRTETGTNPWQDTVHCLAPPLPTRKHDAWQRFIPRPPQLINVRGDHLYEGY